jgi:TRAP-type C4-dicarboxylate transport system substrate-binding protein
MLQNNMMLINKTSFDNLSHEHQLILLDEAARVSAKNTSIQQRREQQMLDEIDADPNTTVIYDVDRDAFSALMTNAYPSMAEKWGTENFDRVVEAIKVLRGR